jgi:signal recognition particle GTPase
VPQAEGVLITGVYGSGKSSVAAEIAYLLEQHGERFALLDLDYLSSAEQIATAEGVALEHVTIVNDRPVDVVAQEIMTFLGWR